MRHSCFQQPDSILDKLRCFHQQHETPVDRLLTDLNAAVGQLMIPVDEFDRGLAFYRDVLGFRLRDSMRLPPQLVGRPADGGAATWSSHPR